MERPSTLLDTLLAVFHALAAFFAQLADGCQAWADRLARFIEALDADCPDWRRMPEARA